MKIIYHCYGGTHSSVLAAALHAGTLDMHANLTWEQLFKCPYFDSVDKKDTGKIFFMGRDAAGDDIYIMGCKNSGYIVETVVNELKKVIEINTSELLMVNTIPCLNNLMRIGGFLSRQLGLITAGRLLLLYGSRQAFPEIKEMVLQVKTQKGRTASF